MVHFVWGKIHTVVCPYVMTLLMPLPAVMPFYFASPAVMKITSSLGFCCWVPIYVSLWLVPLKHPDLTVLMILLECLLKRVYGGWWAGLSVYAKWSSYIWWVCVLCFTSCWLWYFHVKGGWNRDSSSYCVLVRFYCALSKVGCCWMKQCRWMLSLCSRIENSSSTKVQPENQGVPSEFGAFK